ncbi:Clavaminate synthase-like protein [Didymella exigua CBS 183.55]|uniref:Clavaminate synthase-like protein n=1 Tax=Didymella exigua CBS 183.55 TaxID=1150837 RepID=A0A6A5S1C3_9PLEO|nr:Clavaminate synthase-like protein [Didymella exigua CBS 183.55]KAF1934441.1 Clavaminate synthase-like protein [Didymella exigua CBS 183.55]
MASFDFAPDIINGWDKLPAFPSDIETIEFDTISLKALQAREGATIRKIIDSCKTVGFFRIDLSDTKDGMQMLAAANEMFKLSQETFSLPDEILLADDVFGNGESLLGYKGLGKSVVDKTGRRDNNQQYYIGCGDLDGFGRSQAKYNNILHAAFPEMRNFSSLGRFITNEVLDILSTDLNLEATDPQYLPKLHSHSNNSGTHVRLLKCPASAGENANLQAHTDWGSLTVLFNAIGGLQLYIPDNLIPGQNAGWKWVKPVPRTCLVNLGDAMVKWSAGNYKSNIHRVSTPPGEQHPYARYSLAYFVRPDNDVQLRPLGKHQELFPTYKEWALRRAMAGNADTFKNGDWERGQGTESAVSTAARG